MNIESHLFIYLYGLPTFSDTWFLGTRNVGIAMSFRYRGKINEIEKKGQFVVIPPVGGRLFVVPERINVFPIGMVPIT
jgi:hypothetical protein